MDLLRRYWAEEPWGPWRDNLHTAMVCREIRSTAFKGKHELKSFMLVSPERRDVAAERKSFFDFFKKVAKRKPLPGKGKPK